MQGTVAAHRSGGEARDQACSRNNKFTHMRMRAKGLCARLSDAWDNQRSRNANSNILFRLRAPPVGHGRKLKTDVGLTFAQPCGAAETLQPPLAS